MKRPPRIVLLRVLAVLVVAAVTAAVILHRRHRARKKEAARRPAADPATRAAAHRRELAFARFLHELRTTLAWLRGQPSPADADAGLALRRALADRLRALPADDLPPDCAAPWQQFRAALTDDAPAGAAREAAAAFNAALAARGMPDVAL
jgi:hypothetical protein